MRQEGVKLNFEDIDIKTLARLIGQITGRTIVLDQKVVGKVTLVSPYRVYPDEAWEMFVSALDAYGFGVEHVDGVYRVSPTKVVLQRNLGTRTLVAVIKFNNISGDQAANALRPMLSEGGSVTSIPNSNLVVVMDDARTIRKLVVIARRIDHSIDRPTLRIYYPRKVLASELLKNLQVLLPNHVKVRMTVNKRTNALMVLAMPKQHRLISRIIMSLERRQQYVAEAPRYYVYYLHNAQSDDLAKILSQMLAERQRIEKQAAAAGIQTAPAGVNATTNGIQAPHAMPSLAGRNASQAVEPSRETPSAPAPFQMGATTRTPESNFPITQAQEALKAGGFTSAKVSSDPSNNALIFYMTTSEYTDVRRLVQKLDIPQKQVLVSAVIAEVSPKKVDTQGVVWQILSKQGVIVGQGAGQSLPQLLQTLATGNFVVGSVDPTTTSINVNGQTVQFPNNYALLNFLTTTTDFSLLASPRLLTHNHKEASINVGTVEPFATGVKFDINGQPIVNFDYRDIGLDLKLKPDISEGDVVNLQVHTSLQEVTGTFTTGAGTSAVSVPIVSKREVNTNVSLEDGQMLIIGGLVNRSTLRSISKVPILGDIPWLGDLLFSQKNTTVQKTTLFIFLTPHIIDTPQKLREVNQEYDQLFERADKRDRDFNNDWEYHSQKNPRTQVPHASDEPVPGPLPTPEASPAPTPAPFKALPSLPQPAPTRRELQWE